MLAAPSLRALGLTRPLFFIAAMLGAGCGVDDPVVAPASDQPAPELLVAPSRGMERPGFAFLAPVGYWVPRPPGGDFDGALLPQLRVEVCEWTGSACRLPLHRQFSGGNGLTVVDAEYRNLYRAVWQVPGKLSDLGKVYRIRALVSATELGYADVTIVRWLSLLTDGVPFSGSGKVPLGAPIPIRFFVSRDAIGTVGPSGGQLELAGGQVRLGVPAGALGTTATITAVPATGLPATPAIVPGTAWDFGPDGQTFAQPVTMTLRYDPAQLPPGAVESDLRIHKFVNGSYQQQNAGIVDLVNRTVSAQVSSFSVFVILPRVPGREQDLTGPIVTTIEVFDPASGQWTSSAAFDVNAGPAPFQMRIAAQDDISGVRTVSVSMRSPSGARSLFCSAIGAPVSGSDTQGTWVCPASFIRYTEPGAWRAIGVSAVDMVGNGTSYSLNQATGQVCRTSAPADCLSGLPVLTVASDPWDNSPPVVTGNLTVSLDSPRAFAQSISVDASTAGQTAILAVPFTDDLAGISPTVNARFQSAAGGSLFIANCPVVGTLLAGTLECRVTVPQNAAPGTYRLAVLTLRDRAANDIGFVPQPDGRLCTTGATVCVAGPIPEIAVTGSGDSNAPLLSTFEILAAGSTVTTRFRFIDNLSGVRSVSVLYQSTAAPQQIQGCGLNLTTPVLDLTSECAITFNAAAASGQWLLLWLDVSDAVLNQRRYTRRAADGFLCYVDSASQTQICEDYGDTDLMLP